RPVICSVFFRIFIERNIDGSFDASIGYQLILCVCVFDSGGNLPIGQATAAWRHFTFSLKNSIPIRAETPNVLTGIRI
ncbi:MAG: hypothetical protein MUD08_02890, partial [Cytophagales bacterium]|nr:hypothetical protein [Cytophagales bacterium]